MNILYDKIQEEVQVENESSLDGFTCSITTDIMRDPVICADGHSYERESITQWLSHNTRSPKTNLELANLVLIPNYNLRDAIVDSMLGK